MEKRFTADFFRVRIPDEEPRSFAEILSALSDIPDSDERNMTWDKNPIRFTAMKRQQSGNWEGDFVKIRMDYIPPKANRRGGEVVPIELEDDEGIGEEAAFLYDPVYNVLVLQRNRYAVGVTAFCTYVHEKASTNGFVTLEPILRPDAREKMESLQVIRTLKMKFARPTNLARAVAPEGAGLDQYIAALERFGAHSMYLTVTMGRSRGSMDIRECFKIAWALWRQQDLEHVSAIDGLEVDGMDSNGGKEHLDLLEYKMVSFVDVQIPPSRSFDYRLRRSALVNCWKQRKADIADLFERE